MRTNRLFLLIFFSFFVFVLTGCSSNSVYDDFSNNYEESYQKIVNHEVSQELKGKSWNEKVHYYTLKALDTAKPICLIVAAISFIVGLIIVLTVRKERKIKRWAMFTLMVGIPLVMALIIFVLVQVASMT